jgi:exonuclease V
MQIGQEKDQEDSSDYGSDFTPDEEVLLTQLLERADHHRQTQPATPPRQTTLADSAAAQLSDLKEPLLVTDIEDNEIPHSARIPKVLGREAWSPAAKRRQQQQQHSKLPSIPSKAPEHELPPISGMWTKNPFDLSYF